MERHSKRHRRIKYSIAAIAMLIACAFCAGIIYAIVDYYASEGLNEDVTTIPTTTIYDVPHSEIIGGDILDYFDHANHEGLNVTFSHGANSLAEMESALINDAIDMLEADITLRYYGLPNETTEPIMAHPPVSNSDNTLANWLKNVIQTGKGIKMDMKVEEVIPYALQELRNYNQDLHQPTWINADVVQGPNTPSRPINGTYFIANVHEYFPFVTLSLGWSTGYRYVAENDPYSWESMEEMLSLTNQTPLAVTFPIRAALARQSWEKFLWLVEQKERFSLTVWSADTDPVSLEDKMFIRDNFNEAKVFYDTDPGFTDEIKMEEYGERTTRKDFYPGGNVLDYFRIPERNAMLVTWVHAVNSREDLQRALNDDTIMMLEADVQIRNGVPIMAHDPIEIITSNLTLEEWLTLVSNSSNKGIKLDFKSTAVLEPSFQIMRKLKDGLRVPIWINSDILQGPNSVQIPVNADVFFNQSQALFPHCTYSTGWTTFYKPVGTNQGYSQEMVSAMYEYCKNLKQAVTFPVRASLTAQSISTLQWLLSKSNRLKLICANQLQSPLELRGISMLFLIPNFRFSLTVWHSGTEKVPTDDLVQIYNSFDKSKVFYDLPETMMQEFINALQEMQ